MVYKRRIKELIVTMDNYTSNKLEKELHKIFPSFAYSGVCGEPGGYDKVGYIFEKPLSKKKIVDITSKLIDLKANKWVFGESLHRCTA